MDKIEDTAAEAVIPLVEEALRVGKRRVETGRVRVSVQTDVEEQVVRETLRSDRAEIERVAIGLVLREEIRMRLVAVAEPVEQPVTIRRQRASVERLPPLSAGGGPENDR